MDPRQSSSGSHPAYSQEQQMRQMQYHGQYQMPRAELPSEPSVNTIRQQVQRPLQAPQQKLLTTTVQAPPGANLQEFIQNLEDVSPTIPDSVTTYYMQKSGLSTNDPRVVRLISLATQKFISDIVVDTMMQSKTMAAGSGSKRAKPTKVTLTPELLEPVLKQHGIDVTKPAYHH